MSYLNKMYGKKSSGQTQSKSDKNPNRVSGGLRAQGVDRLTMVAEDGTSKEIPSLEYVRSVEEQSKRQRAAIDVLERKLTRQEATINELTKVISQRS